MEVKCSKQENEIAVLKEEVVALKEQNGKLYEDESLKEATTVHHTELVQSLKAIEGELIRRCFTFSICVSIEDSSWVSPPFYSHHRGYLLQLTANMQKFSSIIHQLTYSIFQSGRTTDKGPIILISFHNMKMRIILIGLFVSLWMFLSCQILIKKRMDYCIRFVIIV